MKVDFLKIQQNLRRLYEVTVSDATRSLSIIIFDTKIALLFEKESNSFILPHSFVSSLTHIFTVCNFQLLMNRKPTIIYK